MMERTMDATARSVGVITAALLLAAGTLLGAGPAFADEPAPDSQQARFEVDFLTDTIDHHFLAVQMGELCVEKATPSPPGSDETLRATCEQIVENQQAQIEQMQSWLQDWYGIEKEPTLPPSGEQMLAMLEEAAGEEFDTDVSADFIQHHWRLLPQADRCTERAYHDELVELCAMMYANQIEETQTFEAILQDHGLNRSAPNGRPGGG